jgi:hypothetical protein
VSNFLKPLAAAAVIAVIASPALAQFKKAEPPRLDDFTALECAIVNATDRDWKDPVYKIDVSLTFNQGQISEMWVQHTSMSGSTYVRSDQYAQASIWQKQNVMEWYWKGVRGNNTMVGEVWHNDQGWWYSERLFKQDRLTEYQMVSHCHKVQPE